jgi:putative molybdopterin biosynthesis protein
MRGSCVIQKGGEEEIRMIQIEEERVYTPREISKMFNVSIQTVYNLIKAGEIKSIRFGNQIRIPGESLREYIQEGGKAS